MQKVAYEFVGWHQMVAFTLALVIAAATAGWIVGSRVHRSPGVVGALTVLTVLFPGGLLLLVSIAFGGLPEIAIVGLYAAAPAVVSGSVARAVWRRRPRALRSAA